MRIRYSFLLLLTVNCAAGQSLLKGMEAEPMHAFPVLLQQFNNPALLSLERRIMICAGQQRQFMIIELNRNYITLHVPVFKSDGFAVAYVQSSNVLYQEKFIQSGYSRHFGDVVNVFQGARMYRIKQGEGYGSKNLFGSRTSVSAHVSGLRISTLLDIPVVKDSLLNSGSILKSGVAIKCSEKCWIESSGTLQASHPFFFSGGVFYKADEKFDLRLGIVSQPLTPYAGFAFCYRNWKVDLSAQYHQVFGLSPQISLAFFTAEISK
jgi:hypothetical protein